MPRHYEIDSAWRASIKREPNGRQTVTTEAFVSQLALINWGNLYGAGDGRRNLACRAVAGYRWHNF